jgi:uncharacterized repeat protein (TIGR03803 family)
MTDLEKLKSLPQRRSVGVLTVVSVLAIACGLTIFANPAAEAQTFSVIHAFNGVNGAAPYSGITIRAGVLYGTTLCTHYCSGSGTVYQINHVGSDWVQSPIVLFSSGASNPQARVLFGPDNHLYGATTFGGPQGIGVVFTLTPLATICRTANCFWKESDLHDFTGNPDGWGPGYGDLIWDAMGNIYGTTSDGGTSDLGTVYQMTKSGNNWMEAPIYSFTGPDGAQPAAGVVLDSNGNLFGTTFEGGSHGFGTAFELTYTKDSGWTETVLYNFQNLSDGQQPIAGLITDGAGNYYGAATDGGSSGGGTVFELSPIGNTWSFTVLYSFSGQQGKYCGPQASLTMDNSGNLYGTTFCDGPNNVGNVFKLTNTQNGWEYTSLHDFADGPDGAYPVSNVTVDPNGNLYGTASASGTINNACPVGCGTVWMIKP